MAGSWATGGAMLHYVDGEWQIAPSPTNGGIGAISMVSADEGWAVAN